METVDLTMERLRREADCQKVGVRDLLLLAIDAIDRGEIVGPLRAIIIIESGDEDSVHDLDSFRAACDRYQEIALLRLHETRQIERWCSR